MGTITLDDDTLTRATAQAKHWGLSLNVWITLAIRDYEVSLIEHQGMDDMGFDSPTITHTNTQPHPV